MNGGVGTQEHAFLEFNGFTFSAQGDPAKPGTAGGETERDSTADGVDVAV